MFYINAKGVKIAANCYGDPNKPAVILLHGGVANTSGMQSAFPQKFKEDLAEDYFVVEYDRRCHGYTGYPESFTFEDQADDPVAVMDALCIDKAALIGSSGGAYIGGRSIVKYPERLCCAVLVSGASHDAGGLTPATAYFKRMGIDASKLTPEELMEQSLKATFAPTTPRETIDAFLENNKFDREFPQDLTAKAYKEMAYWDNRPGFHSLDTPVLVITGKYDGFNPPEIGKEMADCLKNGKYLEFEFSAHAPATEEPERFLAEIRAFFEELRPW